MPDKTSILITGGNGLIGRNLASAMRSRYDVHALVHRMPEQKVQDIHYHQIDFSQDWDVADLPRGIDTIYHLAQSAKFRDFPDQAMDVFRVNTQSTATLLDYAHKSGVKRFFYASSGGVYGSGRDVFSESSPVMPHHAAGYYLGSKLSGEIFAQSYAPHMIVNIMRFFFVYGAEQNRTMLIPRLVDNVRNGMPITLQGNDGIAINPIHVSDAVAGLTRLMEREEGGVFNVAGAETHTLRAIATLAGELTGKMPVFNILDGSALDKNLVADIGRLSHDLAAPQISLRQGLTELIAAHA